MERKLSAASIGIATAALRFLYKITLKQNWQSDDIPMPKKPFKLPVVLSTEEVTHFLSSIENYKHRAMLMTAYATGMRVSEVIHLRVSDIDSQRMAIRVDQGKGNKDRYVMLSERQLAELRAYWKLERPLIWLFPGNIPGQPITKGAVELVCQKAHRASRPHQSCADSQQWISCKPGFFLPVRVLSRLFRRLFLELLDQAFERGELQFFNALEGLSSRVAFAKYLAPASNTEWVVYAKPPFGGPEQVLEYLGRYTHRVAISNNRLLDFSDGEVSFAWKDYRHESRAKTMQLDGQEFILRFLLHVLPSGFQRIRHYGLLANRYREANLERCRELLAMPAPVDLPANTPLDYRDRYERLTGVSLRECPHCHHGQMFRIESFAPGKQPRGPPPDTS